MPDRNTMMTRQQVLADFGDFALGSDDLGQVLTQACRLVGDALGTGRAKVLEICTGGQELLVRAGVGWAPGVVGIVRLPMTERSSETYSIKAGEPVITKNIASEDRFDVPEFMKEAGVAALVNVPIFVPGQQPYGVLQVDSTVPRQFGHEDVQFLRTYASILGPVIDRLHLVEQRRIAAEQLRSSKDRFRALFNSIDEGLAIQEMIFDDEGEIVDVICRQVNAAFARQGGILDPVDGSIFEMLPGVERYWLEHYKQVARTGKPVCVEHYQRDVDRWFECYFSRVDEGGRFVATVFNDISGRKRTEAALRESEARHRLLIGSFAQAVWESDPDGVVIDDSPSWRSYTDQSSEEWLGYGWLNAIHPEDREYAKRHWREAIDTQGLVNADFRLRAPGGG